MASTFAVCSCIAGVPASGAEWEITPRLSLSEIYSDNIDLEPSDQATHDFVTELAPGISVRGDGRRVNVGVDYTLQGLLYARQTSADEINHQLDADANVTLIPERASLELCGTLRQENETSRGRVTDSNVTASDNRDTVYTAIVAPSLRHRFKDRVDAQVRYSFETVGTLESDDAAGDAEGADVHGVQADLISGVYFDRLPWSVAYEFSREENDDGENSTFQIVRAQTRYRFNRTWGLIAGVGYEKNDLGSEEDGNVDDGDGFVWTGGATYTPNNRISAEAGVEHRFFGTSFFLDVTAISRRTAVNLAYEESLTTSARRLLDRGLVVDEDAFGDPVEIPDLDDAFRVPTDSLDRSSDVLVSRRFDGSVVFAAERTSLTVAGFHERRRFETGNREDEDLYGASVGVQRRISPRLVASLDGNWQRTEFESDNTEQDFWSVGVALRRQFGRGLFASLELRHAEENSAGEDDDYKENRATLGVNYRF
ncbi:MAG: TIGR03016 family PEP-CTERM system-associated outer membrane protein [Gammaproteobacteria bacterium]